MNPRLNELESPLVLIADDDPTHLLVAEEVLRQSGFRVVTAECGRTALEIFDRTKPDIVILDVEMPGLSGFEICKAIRFKEVGRETPIVLITGLEDDMSVNRAYDLGATDFVNKPIAWSVLPHRIRYVLKSSESLNDLRGLINAVPDLIFIVNAHGEVLQSLVGKDKALDPSAEFGSYPCEHDPIAREYVQRAIETGVPQVYEHRGPGKDVFLETRFIARDANSVLALVRDITQKKEAEAKIFDLAYYDGLTRLPNRQLFGESLDHTIRVAEREKKGIALFIIDLDRFKRINDTLGHSVGDQLLQGVAQRLATCASSIECPDSARLGPEGELKLARLGGDEFVIKLYGVDSQEQIKDFAAQIVSDLTPPFSCDGHQFVVTPSIGVALYPQDGTTREQLLMNADSAMYRAKKAGRNNFKFHSETMRVRSLSRLNLEGEIRSAIENQEFELHYQPKVNVSTGAVVGAEALLRWNNPERGMVSPAEFIPVAEETGLILPISQWVLKEACAQVRKWWEGPSSGIPVAVNISSYHFYADCLIQDVFDAVSAAGIEERYLELEITESMLLRNIDETIAALKTLREAGINLSVDDFGTGYSSLSYLKKFPIDTLKIDRSFVENLHRDKDDAAICAAILAMAKQLGLNVVAEGVELEEQLEFLSGHGCDEIQGYLFSKPVPADEFQRRFLAMPGSDNQSRLGKAVRFVSENIFQRA